MRTLTFNVTDLTSYDSPSTAVSLGDEEVTRFTTFAARDLIRFMPSLSQKGMCVALYDEAGDPISIAPLDSIQ